MPQNKEYIEKAPIIKFIAERLSSRDESKQFGHDAVEIMTEIEYTPPADVVEVVRCKDCDVPHNRWIGCRYLNGLIPPPDFYCAYGKRKMDTDTKPNPRQYEHFTRRFEKEE